MTAHAATKVLPFLTFDPNPINDKSRRPTYRGSRIREFMPPLVLKQHVEISGHEVLPTYEELGWYLGIAVKKIAAPTLSAVTVYTSTYSTTTGSDDRVTATLEYLNDVQDYQIPGCVINKMELGHEEGGPFTQSQDWLGQQWLEGTRTGALSPFSGLEEIDPTTAQIFIDNAGGTIGSTSTTVPTSFKWTYDGRYVQDYGPDGNTYPGDVYSSEGINIGVEMTAKFASKTEFAKAMSNSQRLVQVKYTGGVIAGSTGSVHKSLTFNVYGYWDTNPFTLADGRIMTTFGGSSVYDSGAALDGSVVLVNGVSAYA